MTMCVWLYVCRFLSSLHVNVIIINHLNHKENDNNYDDNENDDDNDVDECHCDWIIQAVAWRYDYN